MEYDRRWRLATGDGRQVIAAVLVDATGRRGRIARMLGARRTVFDHLVGVGRVWEGSTDQQQFVGVEAVPEGWWYSAPLPGGGLITMLMTDADLARDEQLTGESGWGSALDTTVLTVNRVGDQGPIGMIRSHAAFAARTLRDDARPWLAVGDAALSVDPLTGSGIVRALTMAADAAPVVDAMISGRHEAVDDYEQARHLECHQHLYERLGYYAECRRLDSPFWARRHAVADLALEPDHASVPSRL